MAASVSVIVPVRNRRALLRSCLDALAAQTLTDAEVIVVDDGSTDGSGDEARADAGMGRRVRVLTTGALGAVAARRAGVEASGAPYLAFTDSDCVPEPAWLATGVAALAEGADLVNGHTVPARPPAPLERTTSSGEEGLYPTCNLFVRRDAYERAGGFDPAAAARLGFRVGARARGLGFGEDTLLAWRIRRAGTARYAPDAVVAHQVLPPDLRDAASRAWMAAAFPALVREVPELRETLLVGGVGLGSLDRLPLWAAAAAALAGRRQVALAGVGLWAVKRARAARWRPGRHGGLLAAELGLDALTAAALAVGSVRSRTLVM